MSDKDGVFLDDGLHGPGTPKEEEEEFFGRYLNFVFSKYGYKIVLHKYSKFTIDYNVYFVNEDTEVLVGNVELEVSDEHWTTYDNWPSHWDVYSYCKKKVNNFWYKPDDVDKRFAIFSRDPVENADKKFYIRSSKDYRGWQMVKILDIHNDGVYRYLNLGTRFDHQNHFLYLYEGNPNVKGLKLEDDKTLENAKNGRKECINYLLKNFEKNLKNILTNK